MLELLHILDFLKKSITVKVWMILLGSIFIVGILLYARAHPINTTPTTHGKPILEKPTSSIDRNGNKHESIEEKVYTKKEFEQLTDSLKKNLKGKPQIKQVLTTVTVVDTQYVSRNFYMDTGKKAIRDYYLDKNIYLEYSASLLTNEGEFKVQLVPDTATYLTTSKSHLFKSTENKVDIHHSNSLYKTSLGDAYTYKERKSLINLELQGGYNPFNNSFYGGIGIGIPLFSILKTK